MVILRAIVFRMLQKLDPFTAVSFTDVDTAVDDTCAGWLYNERHEHVTM